MVYQGEGGRWSTRGRGAQREGFFGIGVGGCWSGGLISHRISNQASGFQEGFRPGPPHRGGRAVCPCDALRRRGGAVPGPLDAGSGPVAAFADGPAGSGTVTEANSASSASPPTTSTYRVATASTSHNRSTRSGSVIRVACHCQPPRFNSLNPPSIHDLIPYYSPSAWSGSRSGYQEPRLLVALFPAGQQRALQPPLGLLGKATPWPCHRHLTRGTNAVTGTLFFDRPLRNLLWCVIGITGCQPKATISW